MLGAGFAMLICFSPVLGVWMSDEMTAMPYRAMLTATNYVIFRSLVLPSTPTWALSLCAGTVIPVITFIGWVRAGEAGQAVDENTRLEIWLLFQSGLVTIVLAVISSTILYNLRRIVREAKQLGPYTLKEKLGEGGMGVVYKASYALLKRPTAVKILRLRIPAIPAI